MGGNNNNNNNNNQQAGGQQPQGAGGAPAQNNTGNEDYGDKGLDFIEKKSGHTMGRDTNEKITDGARGLYEKATGSQVNSKYSN